MTIPDESNSIPSVNGNLGNLSDGLNPQADFQGLNQIVAPINSQEHQLLPLLPPFTDIPIVKLDPDAGKGLFPVSFSDGNLDKNSNIEVTNTNIDSLTGQIAGSSVVGTNLQELVFIDSSSVEDYQTLIAGVDPNAEVIFLDGTQDGVHQISEALAQHQGISAVHIVSHGSSGTLQLGSSFLSLDTLDDYTSDLTAWANALTPDADLVLYGCDVAAGNEGSAFIEQLSSLTTADVAASTDLTGNAALGGDWDLEATTGNIEASGVFSNQAIASYKTILASLSGNISGVNTFFEDVTITGNVTLTNDVVLDLGSELNTKLTLDENFKISGDSTGSRDNLTITANEVSIKGFIGGGGFQNLTINASKISILDNAFITTRVIADESNRNNFETAESTDNSGAITLNAPVIEIKKESTTPDIKPKLLAHVLDTDTETAGVVKLNAENTSLRLTVLAWGGSDRKSSINVDNATLKGSEVSLLATSKDDNPFAQAPAWVQKAIIAPFVEAPLYQLQNLLLPVSIQVANSTAGVTVNNSAIAGSSKVTIGSTAIADGSVQAITTINTINPLSRIAIAYGRAVGDAQTMIKGNTTITSGGDVSITSKGQTNAKVSATVFGNVNEFFDTPANLEEGGGSLAFANTVTTSKATLDSGSSITAGGNVTVDANGKVASEAKAVTAIFINGTASLGFGVNWDNTTIESTVNGNITAAGSTVGKTIDLSQVDASKDTIKSTKHGLTTGDQIVYSSGGGTKIAGLNDGDTYTVLVVDEDTFKLTKGLALDIDNTGLNSGVLHSFSPQDGIEFDPSTAINTDNETITFANNHGLTTGQQVTYFTDGDSDEAGYLTNQGEYYAIVVDDKTIKLASTLDRAAEGLADITFEPGALGTQARKFDPAAAIDTGADKFTLNNHGLRTGQEVIYFKDPTGTKIDSLTDRGRYYAIYVDANTFKLASTEQKAIQGDADIVFESGALGTGSNHSLNPVSDAVKFNPTTAIDPATDKVTVVNHGFKTGQEITYTSDPAGTAIASLTSGTKYYVIVVDSNTFQLATTAEKANQNQPDIDFVSGALGTGANHLFTPTSAHLFNFLKLDREQKTFNASATSVVNLANSEITIANHGFATGEVVNYLAGSGGTAIGGLTSGRGYFAIVLDNNRIQLANTFGDAQKGNKVTFTSLGTGTAHSFTYAESPIQFDPTDNAIVNSDKNTFKIANHGFQTGDSIFYQVDPTFSTIENLPVSLSFEPGANKDVDFANDTITVANHGLVTGDKVTYQIGFLGEKAKAINGLQVNQDYWVIKVDANTVKLATSQANALSNTAINIETPTLQTGEELGTIHNLAVLRPVKAYDTAIDGLEDSTYYHVVVIDKDTIQLTESLPEAINATPIEIDASSATGTAHTYKRPNETQGISVIANLEEASDKAFSKGALGSNPKIRDFLANPVALGSIAPEIFQPAATKDLLKGKDFNDKQGTEIKTRFQGLGPTGTNTLSVGVGFGLNIFKHEVTAKVGGTAVLSSGTNVTVAASAKQKFQTFADSSTGKDEAGVGIAVSVGLGFYTNTVRAIVDDGATIDAAGKLEVTSKVIYPFLFDYQKDFNFKDDPINATGNLGVLLVDVLFSGNLGIPNRMFNTFITTKNKGKKLTEADKIKDPKAIPGTIPGGDFGLAFSGSFSLYNNTSEAIIGKGAKINQTVAKRTQFQSVLVDAKTDMTLVNGAGILNLDLAVDPLEKSRIFSKKKGDPTEAFNIFGNRSKNGVGVSLLVEIMNNTTTARIEDGAFIHTGALGDTGIVEDNKKKALLVRAKEDIFSFDLVQSGGDAEGFGFSGSAVGLGQTSKTIAQIESGATITGGAIGIKAESNNTRVNVVGSVQATESIGVGLTVGVNSIGRTTKAILGKDQDDTTQVLSSGLINVTGDIDIKAKNTGNLWVFSLAGSSSADNPVEANAEDYGVNVSGNVAVNVVDDTAQAYINDTGTIKASDNVSLSAINDTYIGAFSGGYAIGTGSQKSPNVGLFGSFSYNQVKQNTLAFISGASVEADDITLKTDEDSQIIAGSVGLAGSKTTNPDGSLSVNVAGSVSLNFIENTTEAYLKNATVNARGDLKLIADDTSEIYAIGGAFGFGIATLGGGNTTAVTFGFSAARNDITNTVRSYIDNSKVNQSVSASGGVELSAIAQSKIFALTIGGSLAGTAGATSSISVAGAGAGSGNTVLNTVAAFIENGSVVANKNSTKSLKLFAQDNSEIEADAGGFGFAFAFGGQTGGAGSVGVSASINKIGKRDRANTVKAYIDNSTVSSLSGVELTATSTANIRALSMGGSVSGAGSATGLAGAFAGAGAGSGNTIVSEIEAAIKNGATVNASGNVKLSATDKSTIKADAGGVAIGVALGSTTGAALTFGAAIAENDIDNTVKATINRSNVTASGSVEVTAKSTAKINALTIAGTISGASGQTALAASGAGAGSDNTINNTIEASIINDANVNATGDINVTAIDNAAIKADAGGVAIAAALGKDTSGAVSVGASFAANKIGQSTDYITFDGSSTVAVDVTNDKINFANHNLTTGQRVKYSRGAGTAIGGLTEGQDYYAIVVDDNNIKLATSEANANNGVAINLTGVGTGSSHSLTFAENPHRVSAVIDDAKATSTSGDVNVTARSSADEAVDFNASSADVVNVTNNTIAIQDHGFTTGQKVKYANGGSAIGGLTGQQEYYIIVVNINTIKLASTAADAQNGIAIDLTSLGSGSSHSFSFTQNASIQALTIGGALSASAGQQGLAASGAGAGSDNAVNKTIEAVIRNGADVEANGVVNLTATDTTNITADAGGVAVAVSIGKDFSGALSVGASQSTNTISNTVKASIDNAKVESTADAINLTANSTAKIDALTIAGAISVAAGQTALSGSGAGTSSTNTIDNTIEASIQNNADVDASGAVSLTATDNSTIVADAGGVAVALAFGKSVSVGAALATNTTNNTTKATIDSSPVVANSVALSANSTANIDAFTLGAALSVATGSGGGITGSGAGSSSNNTITNTIEASINNTNNVTANTGSVTLSATDNSTINADAGGVAVAVAGGASGGTAISVGAAIAINTIDNTIKATIDKSTVNASTGVALTATSTADIDALAVAGSLSAAVGTGSGTGGLSGSGAGSETTNKISNSIEASIQDTANVTVTNPGNVTLTATDDSTIVADAGGVAIALSAGPSAGISLAVGASLANNTIDNTVEAYVDNSTVTTPGNVELSATSTADVDVLALAGAGSVGLGGSAGGALAGAGVGSYNKIDNAIAASIRNSSNVTTTNNGTVKLTATDTSIINANAGGGSVAISSGSSGAASLAVGASIAENTINNGVNAYINNSTVTSAGKVELAATSNQTITASSVAVAVAISVPTSVTLSFAGAGSGASAKNKTTNQVASYITGGSQINANGAVNLSALDSSTIKSDVGSGALSFAVAGASVGVSLSENTIGNKVKAYIDGANVTSTTGGITTIANSTGNITAFSIATSVALAIGGAGAGANSTSKAQGTTEAYIGKAADGTSTGNTTITAANGTIQVQANSKVTADADTRVGVGGLVAVGGMKANSEDTQATLAYIGNDATIKQAGAIAINAESTDVVTADMLAGAGSVLANVNVIDATVKVNPQVSAYIGNNVKTENKVSGNVTVEAKSVRAEGDATARSYGGSIGANVSAATVNTTISPEVTSYIGTGSTIEAQGNIGVKAEAASDGNGTPPTDLFTPSTAVDLTQDTIDFGYELPDGTVVTYDAPDVAIGGLQEFITGLGNQQQRREYNVLATTAVTVKQLVFTDAGDADTISRSDGKQWSTDGFRVGQRIVISGLTKNEGTYTIAAINGTTLTLSSGDQLETETASNIAVKPLSIRLGSSFNAAKINAQKDTITFDGPHNFQTGDVVRYRSGSNADVGGLNETQLYYVRKIDDTTIKLASTLAQATAAPLSFSPATNVSGSTLTITNNDPNNNFTNGQVVTYRAPSAKQFSSSLVDVSVVENNGDRQLGIDSNNNIQNVPEGNNIFLENHGFTTGEAVIYRKQGNGAVIGNLVDGGTYYVIVKNADEIQLAASKAEATGSDSGTPNDTSDDIAVKAIDLIPAKTAAADQNVIHTLIRATDKPITGLQDGVSYYVVNANQSAGTFQLAATANGTAITLDAAGITGTHFIGTEGVDLSGAATGNHTLHIDLSSQPAGQHQLLGAGGTPFSQLLPTSGDGKSSTTVVSAGGSLVGDVAVPRSVAESKPTVKAYIAATKIDAGGDVAILSSSAGDISTLADNRAGGAIQIGVVRAKVTRGATTTAFVGQESGDATNVAITAGGNFELSATSDNIVSVSATAEGGGAISAAVADTSTQVDYKTQAKVGQNANITAGNLVNIHTDAATTASSNSKALAVAIGAGADADKEDDSNFPGGVRVGKSTGAISEVEIGQGAIVTGEAVDIDAKVSRMKATATAETLAVSPILLGVATAFSDAEIDIDSDANVAIKSNAQIAGNQGVDIRASHGDQGDSNFDNTDNFEIKRKAGRLAVALIPPQEARALGTDNISSTVNAEAGAKISAGARGSDSQLEDKNKDDLALFVETFNAPLERSVGSVDTSDRYFDKNQSSEVQTRQVTWNSDVEILGVPNPVLEVDASGNITKAVNVSVNSGQTTGAITGNISVDNIQNRGTAEVLFEALNGTIQGTQGTFDFLDTFKSVKITNKSSKQLTVNNIDVVNRTGQPKVGLTATDVTLNFNIQRSVAPTLVDIQNLSASNITLNGLIENPIGKTSILNQGGNILAGTSQTVRTNIFKVDATDKSIGAIAADGTVNNRVNVELVQSPNRASQIFVNAKDDISLSLKGRLRDAAVSDFTINIDPLVAGGDIDLSLQDSVKETTVAKVGGITVDATNEPASQHPDPYYNFFRPDAGARKDQDVGVFATIPSAIASTYRFATRDANGNPTNDPSITAGGNIVVKKAADANTRINIVGITELLGTGRVDFETNGSINITEKTGDLQVGSIRSFDDDVTLTALGSIVDVLNDAASDVTGENITLTAQNGGIGSSTNFLEIDSSNPNEGALNATAPQDIFITETSGDLNVDKVTSTAGDVTLTTRSGSILDSRSDSNSNIDAANIDLQAIGGGIGTSDDDLEINSSTSATGRLVAKADGNIYLTETAGALNVLSTESTDGEVRLTVNETSAQGEDLKLLASGQNSVGTSIPKGRIAAAKSVNLRVGDNVTTTDNSEIVAGDNITIQGDYLNADIGFGSVMDLRGTIQSGADVTDKTQIFGNTDADTFVFNQTFLKGQTNVFGGASTTTGANDGEDQFIVNQLQSMTTSRGGKRDTLNLDGQADTDTYIINTTGSQGDRRDYIINALDTGAKDDGVDTLTINGADSNANGASDPVDDIFLLRGMNSIPGETADSPAFVALLHGTLGQTQTPSNLASIRPQEVQRINYDANINGRLNVYGLGGNDFFASDDNSAITSLDGGKGNDQFQIGQLYGSDRTTAIGNLAPSDVFNTVRTTRGFLSQGNSFSTVVQGGTGDDTFSVYANKADLRLEGDAGNDQFVIRAFALADENGNPLVGDFSTNGNVDVKTGSGDDQVQYNINAPVSIDGGTGFDKVVVLGTEFADNFVISEDGIFGAGVNVKFNGVEVLEIDGLEGDDNFFVTGTPFGIATRIIGGLGSDNVNVGGDVNQSITTQETEGQSGVINHKVSSATDTGYDKLLAPGIDLNVANQQQGAVVIQQAGGETVVREGGTVGQYTVRLAQAPTERVYVTVSAALSASEEAAQGADSLLVSQDANNFRRTVLRNGVPELVDNRSVVLVFDSTNWDQQQTVYVLADDDNFAEGERVVTVSHSVASQDATFNKAAVKNVEVTVLDNDQPGLIINESNGGTLVLEGDATTGITDTYTVQLTKAPAAGKTVTVTLANDGQIALSAANPADTRFSAATKSITFNETNWNTPFIVKVSATQDVAPEDVKISAITHKVTSTDSTFVVSDRLLDVEVLDDETPGVIVTETDGSTLLIKGDGTPANPGVGDTYTVRLTKAPVGQVTIDLLNDGQATTIPTSLTFNETNWFQPQTVNVTANPSFVPTPGTQKLKPFPAQPHLLSNLRGPLEVIGGTTTVNRSLNPAVILPKELNAPLLEIGAQPPEEQQIDTLNIFDDSSQEDKTGVLTATNLSGFNMAGDLTFSGTTAFGEPNVFKGGITYGDPTTGKSTFEVLNLLLGSGNDNLTIESTLSTTATHGGITTVHGGGNRYLTNPTTGAFILDGNGQKIVGGDTITVNGGGGSASPLVIYGDTSQDGIWYSGSPETVTGADFGQKPFDQVGTASDRFLFPLANSFDLSGNDIIDARNLFKTIPAGQLPSVGLTVYGGAGNDTIYGSQTGDHLAGGSGDDTIYGQRGADHIYGDSGVNVDVITRTLTIPTANTSTFLNADNLVGGKDKIFGDFEPNATVVAGNPGEFDDLIFGDHGEITQNVAANAKILTTSQVLKLTSKEPNNGDSDEISGELGNDIIIGGAAGDKIVGGANNDLIFGDHGLVETNVPAQPINRQLLPLSLPVAQHPFRFESIFTLNSFNGGNDLIYGDDTLAQQTDGKDIVLGQQGADTVYGGSQDDDIVGGHNVAGGNDGNDVLDGGTGNDVIAGDNASILRRGDALTPRIRVLNGQAIYDGNGTAQVTGSPQVNPTGVEERQIVLFDHSDTPAANTFGNDNIAGGAQDDVIFGQLGDDTIQGDASVSINASSTTPSVEDFAGAGTDGDDYIEGNGGGDLILGNLGQDDIIGGSSNLFSLTAPTQRPDGADTIFGGAGTDIARNDQGDTSANGHARDADYILGDNGNILRLIGINGQFLKFNYDFYGSLKLIPRAIQLLDYTQGGATSDRGTADVVHGESGDDVIHGMTGNDVLFGEGQDDDIYGGTGSDRIYAGTGEDGVLGDDGKIITSRNGLIESLYGVNAINAQTQISLPGPFTGAWLFITGRLNKTVDLAALESGGSDIIYGGLGDDFLHGGAGDDGISGAEAQAAFYNSNPVTNTNPLGYDPVTRKLAAYDANNPLKKINNFFLNFDAVDAASNKINDGKDRVFGDLGNDWLVGGTQNDRLFGGFGDDLMNADDNHDTAGGLNNQPDAVEFADRDFAFGGGGLDVLIANTGGDRLFDWRGEFNSYVVPFSAFGNPTVVRSPSPHIQQFLLDLGKESGADRTLSEPNGELGLVTQQDPQWQDQGGSPRDPQPGNTQASRDTQGGPEDDRATALPLTGGGNTNPPTNPPTSSNGNDVTVNQVFVAQDPTNSTQSALFIGGGNSNDNIEVRRGSSASMIRVFVNGTDKGEFARTSNGSTIGRIMIYGNAGNDTITINSDLDPITTVIYGDVGNDTIRGGNGYNVIDGGDGSDFIYGGTDNDILLGSSGQDTINADKGDDILISGKYKYSSDLNAIAALLAAWLQPVSYSQRITNLKNGVGFDSFYALNPANITDDNVVDSLTGDTLDGVQGQDWFLVSTNDNTDKKGNETVN
ncbi:DUF4347 domain-containing protein [Nostoc sp. FACHB-973]|nr:DUF4347 domain-containing protein [Nostoc sp. FACHB-973]